MTALPELVERLLEVDGLLHPSEYMTMWRLAGSQPDASTYLLTTLLSAHLAISAGLPVSTPPILLIQEISNMKSAVRTESSLLQRRICTNVLFILLNCPVNRRDPIFRDILTTLKRLPFEDPNVAMFLHIVSASGLLDNMDSLPNGADVISVILRALISGLEPSSVVAASTSDLVPLLLFDYLISTQVRAANKLPTCQEQPPTDTHMCRLLELPNMSIEVLPGLVVDLLDEAANGELEYGFKHTLRAVLTLLALVERLLVHSPILSRDGLAELTEAVSRFATWSGAVGVLTARIITLLEAALFRSPACPLHATLSAILPGMIRVPKVAEMPIAPGILLIDPNIPTRFNIRRHFDDELPPAVDLALRTVTACYCRSVMVPWRIEDQDSAVKVLSRCEPLSNAPTRTSLLDDAAAAEDRAQLRSVITEHMEAVSACEVPASLELSHVFPNIALRQLPCPVLPTSVLVPQISSVLSLNEAQQHANSAAQSLRAVLEHEAFSGLICPFALAGDDSSIWCFVNGMAALTIQHPEWMGRKQARLYYLPVTTGDYCTLSFARYLGRRDPLYDLLVYSPLISPLLIPPSNLMDMDDQRFMNPTPMSILHRAIVSYFSFAHMLMPVAVWRVTIDTAEHQARVYFAIGLEIGDTVDALRKANESGRLLQSELSGFRSGNRIGAKIAFEVASHGGAAYFERDVIAVGFGLFPIPPLATASEVQGGQSLSALELCVTQNSVKESMLIRTFDAEFENPQDIILDGRIITDVKHLAVERAVAEGNPISINLSVFSH